MLSFGKEWLKNQKTYVSLYVLDDEFYDLEEMIVYYMIVVREDLSKI